MRRVRKQIKRDAGVVKVTGNTREEGPMALAQLFQEKILSNHLILHEILKYLSPSSLRSGSLVNKFWNRLFRKALQDSGNLLSLKNIKSLRKLQDVAALMENTTVLGTHPFGGVKIKFTIFKASKFKLFHSEEIWDETFENRVELQRIFAALDTKHVVFDFKLSYDSWNLDETQMLHAFNSYITAVPTEKLLCLRILTENNWKYSDFFKPLRGITFPMLKSLCITHGRDFVPKNNPSVAKIRTVCPALEELLVPFYVQQVLHLKGSRAISLIRILYLGRKVTLEQVNGLEKINLRLKKMISDANASISPESYFRIIRTSVDVLQEIWVTLTTLDELVIFPGFPRLPNVTKLVIKNKWEFDIWDFSEKYSLQDVYLKNCLIRQIFPNLKVIKLIFLNQSYAGD